MAARLFPLLILVLVAAVGAPAHTQSPPTSGEDDDGPSALERVLQGRYLDKYFLLREDIKIETVKSQNVIATTTPVKADMDRVRPITIVTPDGVFYSSDYDNTVQLETNVRVGASYYVGSDPAVQGSDVMRGGNIGSVTQYNFRPMVIMPAYHVARIVGAVEVPAGVQLTLEGFSGEASEVLLRGESREDRTGDADARADWYATLLNALFFDLPSDPAARLEWVDPGWPVNFQNAIRAGQVTTGMDRLQVVLAWGLPVYVSRDGETGAEIWMFKRGATIVEQMRNHTNVSFAAGKVVDIQPSGPR